MTNPPRTAICPLFEGTDYTVWAAPQDAVIVQRHRDGEEWQFLPDGKEDNLLRDLLPDTRWDAKRVDLACEDAWTLLGPKH